MNVWAFLLEEFFACLGIILIICAFNSVVSEIIGGEWFDLVNKSIFDMAFAFTWMIIIGMCIYNVPHDFMAFATSLEIWVICIFICSMHVAHKGFEYNLPGLGLCMAAILLGILFTGISTGKISGYLWMKGPTSMIFAGLTIVVIFGYNIKGLLKKNKQLSK